MQIKNVDLSKKRPLESRSITLMIDHIAVTSLFTTQHILLIKFQNLHFVTPRPQLKPFSQPKLQTCGFSKHPILQGFPDMGNMGSQLAFNNYSTAPVLSDNSEITQNIYMYKMEVKVNNKGKL